jgi:hypothetical protein
VSEPKKPRKNAGQGESGGEEEAEEKTAGTSTRDALEFCFEDVSSIRSLGAAPLNDLFAGPGAGPPAGGASPAGGDRAGSRWNLLLLALLLLTLGVAASATWLGR